MGDNGSISCYNTNYVSLSLKCNANTIIRRRNHYIEQTRINSQFDKEHKYAYKNIIIPNLGEQISLYLEDKNIRFKNDSIFIIYIGGNDISNYLQSHKLWVALMPESYIKKSLNKYMTSIATNVLEELSRITTPFNRYHYNYHVYIMTLPDLSNFKEAHSFITKPIIGKRFYDAIKYATISYNRALIKCSITSFKTTILKLLILAITWIL